MNAYDTGRRITELRRNIGLSQSELAQKLNVDVRDLRKWENGSDYPELYVLSRLSEVLDTPITIILGLTYISAERALSEILELAQEEKIRSAEKMRFRGYILQIFSVLILCWIAFSLYLPKEREQIGFFWAILYLCAAAAALILAFNGMKSADKASEILKSFRKEE